MDAEIFRRPGHLITRCARLLQRAGEQLFKPLGLGIAQLPVLYSLKGGNSMTQTELATLARIEQPTMAQLLTRMERDGLIRRSPNPQDKRSSLIALTPLALGKLPAARSLLLEGSRDALAGFSEVEIATLSQLLLRVVKNLDPEAPGL
ncbi:MarR family winged helix-turn-helix transcriptional regulator [Granulicella tundricola]|uniref:Transcriptional regulator, MarR family n=1 Tax=Granulicella tundricola (strain ATCC BAA-1859 / DSM 23138 / MP5ACTX9) TaxID=1198114 RepID=E8X2C7_GRATM|nr:MarR family transcriptional regulator [Granulicella tundricola]ADW68059.1 transcriptional regulator, MarR family [Granulicella tundricola MP5ACTX9]